MLLPLKCRWPFGKFILFWPQMLLAPMISMAHIIIYHIITHLNSTLTFKPISKKMHSLPSVSYMNQALSAMKAWIGPLRRRTRVREDGLWSGRTVQGDHVTSFWKHGGCRSQLCALSPQGFTHMWLPPISILYMHGHTDAHISHKTDTHTHV